jgi:hypothetical protein
MVKTAERMYVGEEEEEEQKAKDKEGGGRGEGQTNARAFLNEKDQRNSNTVIVRPSRLDFFLKLFNYLYLVHSPCC